MISDYQHWLPWLTAASTTPLSADLHLGNNTTFPPSSTNTTSPETISSDHQASTMKSAFVPARRKQINHLTSPPTFQCTPNLSFSAIPPAWQPTSPLALHHLYPSAHANFPAAAHQLFWLQHLAQLQHQLPSTISTSNLTPEQEFRKYLAAKTKLEGGSQPTSSSLWRPQEVGLSPDKHTSSNLLDTRAICLKVEPDEVDVEEVTDHPDGAQESSGSEEDQGRVDESREGSADGDKIQQATPVEERDSPLLSEDSSGSSSKENEERSRRGSENGQMPREQPQTMYSILSQVVDMEYKMENVWHAAASITKCRVCGTGYVPSGAGGLTSCCQTCHQYVKEGIPPPTEETDEKRGSLPYASMLPCPYCHRLFLNNEHISEHKRLHIITESSNRIYRCTICDKEFSRKSHLQIHMGQHGGRKAFNCSVCSRPFFFRSQLSEHLLTHSEDKPFRCALCNKSVTRKRSLQQHMLTHTGEKPHSCTECGKCFAKRCNLRRHALTHTQEKPYRCEACGKRFKSKEYLKEHTRNIHPQVPVRDEHAAHPKRH